MFNKIAMVAEKLSEKSNRLWLRVRENLKNLKKEVLHQKKKKENLSEKKADTLIKKHKTTIEKAARHFHVDKYIIAAVIYKEQVSCNYLDNFDTTAGLLGLDTSVWIGQVKVRTAEKVEKRKYIKEISREEINRAGSEQKARVARLANDKWNIEYVSAYLSNLQDIRKKDFPSIYSRPDILATLYNIGKEEAHSNPKSNNYGRDVENIYWHMKQLMW